MKYRRKPETIDAFQWDGSIKQIFDKVPKDYQSWFVFERQDGLRIPIDQYKDECIKNIIIASLHGGDKLHQNDYVALVDNHHYVRMNKNYFKKHYEKVD